MINLNTLGVLMVSSLVFSVQDSLVKAHQQISEDKIKKADLERQKIFLLSFSHEIRNLINSMTGSIQLAILENLPVKVDSLLHNSQVCGEMLLHLVNNILDTGKVEVGELEINPAANRIDETLEKVWSVCAQLIKAKKLTGKMRVKTCLPSILIIDNYRLMQIMLNLVGNSIKFTENGSINIDVEWILGEQDVTPECFEPVPFDEEDEGLFDKSQACKIFNKSLLLLDLHNKKLNKRSESNIQQAHNKGILKIIVTDSGSGIPEDNIHRLFKKFSQVSSDPSKRKLGTGLGLFITKQLIEKMGGQIKAYSKLGKGTVFIVCIPVEAIQAPQKQARSVKTFIEMVESAKLNAMIVDDAEFNLVIINSTLTKLGVNVDTIARNGSEAFEKYKENVKGKKSFDVVTMDVETPVMDGKKAVQLIRAYEREFDLEPCLIIIGEWEL